MKVRIGFSDGAYSYAPADAGWPGEIEVEVPDEVVALWDAIVAMDRVMQQQLAALDNAWYEKRDAGGDR